MKRLTFALALGALLLLVMATAWAWSEIGPRFVATACTAGLALVTGLLFFEDRLVFRPSRRPVGRWLPQDLAAEERTFSTQDGYQLHGWWCPGGGDEDPAKRPVLLWSHGSSGNVTHSAAAARALAAQGFAFLLFDYRGYGKSQGRPSEHGLYLDGEAAYRHLVEQLAVAPGRIVCFGQGLGSTVALHVALLRKTAGVMLEGAQEDAEGLARGRLVLLPLVKFGRNRFDNATRVRKLKVPLLMAHGEKDQRVPLELARAVFGPAPQPKQFHMIEGAGHGDAFEHGGPPYWAVLRRFCDECLARARERR